MKKKIKNILKVFKNLLCTYMDTIVKNINTKKIKKKLFLLPLNLEFLKFFCLRILLKECFVRHVFFPRVTTQKKENPTDFAVIANIDGLIVLTSAFSCEAYFYSTTTDTFSWKHENIIEKNREYNSVSQH